MIEYVKQANVIAVKLDGSRAGSIRQMKDGWRYYPKGRGRHICGQAFPTLEECKKSLERIPGED